MLKNHKAEQQQTDNFLNSAEHLRQLFMQAPGLMAILRGREGICELYNPLFGTLWGNRHMLHKPMREAWPELENQGNFEIVEQVFDSGETIYQYEHPQVADWNNDGKPGKRYFDFVYSPNRNDRGDVDGVMIFGMDVTAKTTARLELAEQQLLFKNITDAAGTALWMIDADGEITFVNQAWIEWTGRPIKAHLGRGWIRSVMPDDRYRVINTYLNQFKNKEPYNVDFRLLRADGQLQWVAATGKPRYLANGAFAGYVGSCMDITERKNAEQAARKSQERFRLIADTAPVLIWMSGPDGKISFLNKRFLNFLGLTSISDYPENPLDTHVYPEDQERLAEVYTQAFKQQSDYYIEYRIRSTDGDYRWVAMKGVPNYDEDGTFKGYIGSGMDITEMKEHEQVKNDFIGMASHELKTPITSIKAYVQLLLGRHSAADDEDFTKRSLTTVNKQINRLTRLIADLLDVSKMDSGRLSLNLDNIVLNDTLKEAIDEVQHTSGSHKIVLQQDNCYNIIADKDRIAQVITNFLTNAVKYSPAASEVEVSVTGNADEVTIAVRDYGIGISEEDQQRVFNRFFRVEGKNEQTFSGFGIGLFIAAEIIKRHNGSIGVNSIKGKGTTFYFKLPVTGHFMM